MTEKLYRIHWRNLKNGATGHGNVTFELQEAQDYCDWLNTEYAKVVKYWIEPVPNEQAKSEAQQ